jgi:hypothetical protein
MKELCKTGKEKETAYKINFSYVLPQAQFQQMLQTSNHRKERERDSTELVFFYRAIPTALPNIYGA